MHKHDVIFIGSTCCDLIFNGLPSLVQLGEEIWAEQLELTVGGMMNSAAALARLGLRVGLTAEIGEDLWGKIILSKMMEEGIDIQFVQKHVGPYPQVTVALNFMNDRSFVSYAEKRNLQQYMQHVIQVMRNSSAAVYHISAQQEYAELILAARQEQKVICLDTSWNEAWLQSSELKALIRLADIFMPNLKEAQMITGRQDPHEALVELSALCPLVVIKLGEDGALCQTGGKQYHSPAFPANVLDSTGAGDCFAAGFLYGWITRKDIEESLAIANYCGSKCVEALGGYTGAPTLDQLLGESFIARKLQ